VLKKLNLGCGAARITDAVNVDMNPDVKPDLCFNLTESFPLSDEQFDEVYFFHCIEHIEKFKQPSVLAEIHRVTKLGGTVYISYPEFSEIANHWLKRTNNDRSFWEKTMFGRQLYAGDYHYAAMDTVEFKETLFLAGFNVKKQFQEPTQPFNTVLVLERGYTLPTYEELLYKEIFA